MAGFPQTQLPQIPYYTALEGVYKGFNDADNAQARELSNLHDIFSNAKMMQEMGTYDQRTQQALALQAAQEQQARSHADLYDKQARADADGRYADRMAKADALKQLEAARSARAALQGVQGSYNLPGYDPNQALDQLFQNKAVPDFVSPILRPDANTNNYTKDALARAISSLEERDPLMMGQRKVETQQNAATERNNANIESRQRIAQWGNVQRQNLAALKANKAIDKIEAGFTKYTEMAFAANTPEERQVYQEMADKYKNAATEIKAASAVAAPEARADSSMGQLGLFQENAKRKKAGLPELNYREYRQQQIKQEQVKNPSSGTSKSGNKFTVTKD